MNDVKVSIGIEFLNAYSQIAHSEQKRVREFIEKFWENPRSSSINYEKIHDMKDKNVRTVRINDAYRAIVLNPESGNNFVLVWVDHHDEAMRWAKNKKFDVNKYTGAIEVIDYEFVDKIKEEENKWVFNQKTLFCDIADDDLLMFGVPEVFLTTIKNIDSECALDQVAKYLPQEVSEALYYLASGCTVEQTLNEIASKPAAVKAALQIATPLVESHSDYSKALENENSKTRFRCVEDAKELAEILDAPLEKWRVFLHPTQRKLAEMISSGPVRILGGAGTGKTVVAIHRAKYLAEKVFTAPTDKILFTTFSKSLATNIRNCLSTICFAETMQRIEVTNIDLWVTIFLKRHGYNFQIVNDVENKLFWHEAMKSAPADIDLGKAFYRDEWRIIIQPNAVFTLEDYLGISRTGSGRSLTSDVRQKVWPVFEAVRKQFKDNNRVELIDLSREALKYIEKNPGSLSYKAIIIDEGQDIGAEAYKLLRKMLPEGTNDIFILSDSHQKIYAQKVILSHCGINIKGQRTKKLKLNYRTTEEIKRWALKLFEKKTIDDLDGGIDIQEGYRSLLHGAEPSIKMFDTEIDEIEFLVKHCRGIITNGAVAETICVVARTNDIVNRYKEHFSKSGLPTFLISRDAVDKSDYAGIRFATMHRVKGLEFDYILMAAVSKDIIPLKRVMEDIDNETALEEADLRERALLYVAATRAKKEVIITCNGEKSEYLG